jgi:hypothetical protein
MREIVLACITAAVLAVIAGFVLNALQVPADEGFSESASVRVGPGQQ